MRPLKTPLLIALCTLPLGPPAITQEPLADDTARAMERIRPYAIRAHMRFLADDLLEGRDTATRGYDLAAKYVASVFETLGLEPGGPGGSYFQPVPMVRTTLDHTRSSVTLTRDGRTIQLQNGVDYAPVPSSGLESQVTAPVVFVGFGATAPELNHDDYAGLDVRGKIAALLMGAPTSFPNDQRAYYSDRRVQIWNALDHGAVGILAIPTEDFFQRMPWEALVRRTRTPNLSWADESGMPRDSRPEMRGGAMLSREGAAKLFAGAPKNLEEILKTAATGKPSGFPLPVEVSVTSAKQRELTASANVAAVLRGSDPVLRDEYIVVSAHLDHVGIGEPVKGDAIYNGAYDNASGIAVLLEMAKAFASLPTPPRRSVLFLAVTGEEAGLHGSDYFARHPTVPPDRVVANVNMDMFLMLFPIKDVVGFGAEHSSLGATLEKAARQLGISVSPDPFPEEVVFIRSDQYSFIRQGVPAIFIANGVQTADPALDGPALLTRWRREFYHKPQDDMNQPIDFEVGVQFAKLNFLVTYLAAQDDQAPKWNPGDFFGNKFGRAARSAPAP